MLGLCKYKNALGKPNEGLHKYRIGGFALVDILLTAGLALIGSRAFHYSFIIVFLILLIVAIGLHEAFCVNTRLNALIFGRQWPPQASASEDAN
jgi:hypothetical protein